MKRSLTVVAVLILALLAGLAGYLYSKQPTRQGQVELNGLQGSVTVRYDCLLYTSPSPRDQRGSRMPSSA